ncbi:hypothetical protein WKW79_35785 [Variovorax robiniae]|uniref:Uncharacterized protein n=1 Tax=Variovorax robiniae TaxID=1836199 RepID=A0ABU8XKB2_9BURK
MSTKNYHSRTSWGCSSPCWRSSPTLRILLQRQSDQRRHGHLELHGGEVVARIFAGVVNWLGQLFSDAAGSSGAQGRGSDIPIPFFSLLQFVNIGDFGQHRQTCAQVAVRVSERGYDLRHGIAPSIQVLITDLLTRMTWVIKQRYVHKRAWSDCCLLPASPNCDGCCRSAMARCALLT